MAIINASQSDPIYLFNGFKDIQDSFTHGKIAGKLQVTLSCGTVRHMQHLIQNVGQERQQ